MRRYDRIKAVVSLDAIAHNFGEMKKNIAKGTKIIAVIKADGYGHGAEAIARLIPRYNCIVSNNIPGVSVYKNCAYIYNGRQPAASIPAMHALRLPHTFLAIR